MSTVFPSSRVSDPLTATAGQTDFEAGFPPPALVSGVYEGLYIDRIRDGVTTTLTVVTDFTIQTPTSDNFICRLLTPALVGDVLYIYGQANERRNATYAPGALNSAALEAEFTRQAMRLQEHRRDIARSLMTPLGEASVVVPSAVSRAGKILGFDDGGKPIVFTPLESASAAANLDLSNVPGGSFGDKPFSLEPSTLARSMRDRWKNFVDPTEYHDTGVFNVSTAADNAAFAAAVAHMVTGNVRHLIVPDAIARLSGNVLAFSNLDGVVIEGRSRRSTLKAQLLTGTWALVGFNNCQDVLVKGLALDFDTVGLARIKTVGTYVATNPVVAITGTLPAIGSQVRGYMGYTGVVTALGVGTVTVSPAPTVSGTGKPITFSPDVLSIMLDFYNCKGMTGEDIKILNMGHLGISTNSCEDANFSRIQLNKIPESTLNYGLNMSSSLSVCKNISLKNSRFKGANVSIAGERCSADSVWVSGQGYSSCFLIQATTTSKYNSITNCRGSDTTSLDSDNTPGNGIENWSADTTIDNFTYTNGNGWAVVSPGPRPRISRIISEQAGASGAFAGVSVGYVTGYFTGDCANIEACMISGSGASGIDVTAKNAKVRGNTCKNNGRIVAAPGIWIKSVSSQENCSNSILTANECYDDQMVPTQEYGAKIDGGNNTNVRVAPDNDFTRNTGNGGSATGRWDLWMQGTSETVGEIFRQAITDAHGIVTSGSTQASNITAIGLRPGDHCRADHTMDPAIWQIVSSSCPTTNLVRTVFKNISGSSQAAGNFTYYLTINRPVT